MALEDGLFVCEGAALVNGGRGMRFPVVAYGHPTTGFVIRYGGKPFAYLNRCAHVPIELDWSQGNFFESSGLYLMCSTHGAMYAVGGPCRGGRLRPIGVIERDGGIWWQPDDMVQAAGDSAS